MVRTFGPDSGCRSSSVVRRRRRRTLGQNRERLCAQRVVSGDQIQNQIPLMVARARPDDASCTRPKTVCHGWLYSSIEGEATIHLQRSRSRSNFVPWKHFRSAQLERCDMCCVVVASSRVPKREAIEWPTRARVGLQVLCVLKHNLCIKFRHASSPLPPRRWFGQQQQQQQSGAFWGKFR